MKRAIYILCGLFAVVSALFTFRETSGLQLLSMLFFLGLFISVILSLVYAFRSWSLLRWRALLPFAACAIVFLVPSEAGRFARDAYFRRQIPRLEAAVQAYRSSGQLPDTHWTGYMVLPRQESGGGVVIEFLWGGGFPVKHTSLIYVSSDDPKDYFHKRGWYYGYHLQDHWWVMKD